MTSRVIAELTLVIWYASADKNKRWFLEAVMTCVCHTYAFADTPAHIRLMEKASEQDGRWQRFRENTRIFHLLKLQPIFARWCHFPLHSHLVFWFMGSFYEVDKSVDWMRLWVQYLSARVEGWGKGITQTQTSGRGMKLEYSHLKRTTIWQ